MGNQQVERVYIGYTEKVDYHTAKSRCECNQGELAGFGSDEEFDTIKEVRSLVGASAWLGLDDLGAEHYWEFIDGDHEYCSPQSSDVQDCDDLDQWAPGEPNNYGSGQDCALIWPWYGGTLDDDDCSTQQAYICEYDASEVKTANTILVPVMPWMYNHDQLPWITLVSVLLNLLFISCIGWMTVRSNCKKASPYSKVKMYSESEDEEQRLNK
eukprot:269527_1